jgi:pilus assembly protein CpaF
MDALVAVEARLRDGVRTRGLDPLEEPHVVRALVDDAVADVVAEWVARDRDLLADPGHIARLAFDAVAGFGPLQPYFDDPDVEELWINERIPDR